MTQDASDQNDLKAETMRVQKLLLDIQEVCNRSANTPDIYAALTYALGRVISLANDPAALLCLTIPKLASAAKIRCMKLESAEDLEALEEELTDDQPQSTH
jgi:hypothetical protein